jgi:hypothetical protein
MHTVPKNLTIMLRSAKRLKMIYCKKHNSKLAVHYYCPQCKTSYATAEEAKECCNTKEIEIIFWCEKCFDYPSEVDQRLTNE